MSTTSNEWSVPETELFARIRDTLEAGEDAVLATVVDIEGSAYRRPGAKMLLDPEGGGAGSITAGCLEDEVRTLAADVLAAGEPRIETWDLTGDDDVWGMGVGCNGVITVLLEPLGESFRPVVAARESGENVGVVTVLDGDLPLGTRGVYRSDSGFTGESLPESLRAALDGTVEQFLAEGTSDTLRIEYADGAVEVFVDAVRAPPELVVFGSGHDVRPVVELAKRVDFRVTVVAFRGGQADDDRFERADSVVSASPRDVENLREWDDDSYAVVMTHNFVDDRLTLAELLDTPIPYIGLMGPDERFEEILEACDEEGTTVSEADRKRIFTPIGLNLGGDTPYQIAFSIVSELLAVSNDRTPQHLNRQSGPIHDRPETPTE
ncbi:XdhC family protein [Natronomonas gomsonensis]|uniref:XdhC family protein n=1 Tax=Natronomonas gomsonensis TaxID=1046043 RepID=UPI0020CA7CDD|nr:XdhC/CoxI family protein [Natronomonas gomsonensis]MCY4729709.1 XdhC family protein [Natronomonas gomsonensis]